MNTVNTDGQAQGDQLHSTATTPPSQEASRKALAQNRRLLTDLGLTPAEARSMLESMEKS